MEHRKSLIIHRHVSHTDTIGLVSTSHKVDSAAARFRPMYYIVFRPGVFEKLITR